MAVIEHVRFKDACRTCQEHVAVAPPPHKPISKGRHGRFVRNAQWRDRANRSETVSLSNKPREGPGPGLLSAIVVGQYADHLPLYRLEDVLARQGVVFSRSTLCRWALRTADILEPLHKLLIERVLSSPVIHTDDTPVPVLDPE